MKVVTKQCARALSGPPKPTHTHSLNDTLKAQCELITDLEDATTNLSCILVPLLESPTIPLNDSPKEAAEVPSFIADLDSCNARLRLLLRQLNDLRERLAL